MAILLFRFQVKTPSERIVLPVKTKPQENKYSSSSRNKIHRYINITTLSLVLQL